MNIIIREARPEDVRDIQNVYHETWLDTYPSEEVGVIVEDIEENFKNAYSKETLDNIANKIRTLPVTAKFLIAVVNDKVVGLCRISIKEEFNQLNAIYVLPAYQGMGIGLKFWDESMIFFDKNKRIIVQVATYNSRAIKFYEKLGFRDNGKRFTEERHRMPISKVLIPELEMEL
jgi:ribosomal protein S18 acetylase RimI-like enzyme